MDYLTGLDELAKSIPDEVEASKRGAPDCDDHLRLAQGLLDLPCDLLHIVFHYPQVNRNPSHLFNEPREDEAMTIPDAAMMNTSQRICQLIPRGDNRHPWPLVDGDFIDAKG